MGENSLIIYNNGIIGKVKKLFKNLFKKRNRNKMLFLPEATPNKQLEREIIIPLDQERERIKKLQRKFQNRELKEQDISPEDM